MNKNKIVDLSLTIEEGMISYQTPAHAKFKSTVLGRIPVEGRETRKFCMGSHCATHVDAPKHFFSENQSIDQISLEILVGTAFLLNLGTVEPKTVIDLNSVENVIKDMTVERLVLRTDWSRFWNSSQYYKDWPCLSFECAEFISKKGIKLLAMDFPSPDPAYNGDE